MNSYNVSSLIDIDSPQINSQLRFQDFPEQPTPTQPPPPYSEQKYEEEPTLQPETISLWSIKYYQRFFDVNTDDVVNRIKWSMIPRRLNYLQTFIQSKPDLYGPFWISVTLVFTIAISGNIANYLQAAVSHNYKWKYDFHTVSSAASAIICYAWLLPSLLWAYLKWNSNEQEEKANLLELICLYGYCISIYIPVSILWVIQVNWLQWVLVLVGAALSGSVLISSITSQFSHNQKWIMSFGLAILHILLAISFMLYFFHVPSATNDEPIVMATSARTTNTT